MSNEPVYSHSLHMLENNHTKATENTQHWTFLHTHSLQQESIPLTGLGPGLWPDHSLYVIYIGVYWL